MSFKDIFKSSVYEAFVGGATQLDGVGILVILAVAGLIGIYIYWIYRLSSKAAFYSRDLNVSLAIMPVIIAAIMVAMQASLLVSLGMVGALSIVRFRNAVKNPMDLVYLFWSVSAGIICGVGLHTLAVCLCVITTLLLMGLQSLPSIRASSVLVLRSRERNLDWKAIEKMVKENTSRCKQKARSFQAGEVEVIYELTTKNEQELLDQLQSVPGLQYVGILSHDGEYRV